MNITIFVSSLAGGGAERVACNLANFLAAEQHNVRLLTISDMTPSYDINPLIKRKALSRHNSRIRWGHSAVILLRTIVYLLTVRTDVYVVMLPRPTSLLLRLRFLTKGAVIASQRIDPSNLKVQTQKQLLSIASKADGWIFQTVEQQKWFEDRTKVADKVIIPNAVNPIFFKNIFKRGKLHKIVSVGRLTRQKNHALLINAFARTNLANQGWVLEIIGKGPLIKDLEDLAQSLCLTKNVNFLGFTTNIIEVIQDASLFVLTSDYEGIPNALLEAMALGLPCISTDCDGGGARLLINNGVNGVLVPKNDVVALAKAMDEMLKHPDEAQRMGQNALKVSEDFAPDKIYSEWERFINQVVAKTSSRS